MGIVAEVGILAFLDATGFNRGAQIVRDTMGKLSKDMEETEESSAGAGGALDMLGGVATGVATGGLTILVGAVAAVGTALVGTATAGLKFATEFGGVMRTVEAQTGATGAELENFRNITEEVYQTGLGESFEDVAMAMVQVEQMTGTAGEELQTLTANALTMSEVFDVDVAESVRAVDQAMIAFGAEGTDVFDMMTVTIQATGDPMDDLADTVNEYSTIFAQAGFSVDEMFGILNAGLEAGAFNFDKVGDAVKEFFVRLQDGSDTTRDALNELFSEPDDKIARMQGVIDDLTLTIEDQEAALIDTKTALDEAEGAWGAAQQVVKELESALNEARMELQELAHPDLAGMAEFDDQIFGLEQNVKKVRLAMLDMEKDTPEFDAAKEDLDGMNKELEKLRLAKDIKFDAAFRELEKAVADGTVEVVTLDEAFANIGAQKAVIWELEGALQGATDAEMAAATEVERLESNYNVLAEQLGFNKEEMAAMVEFLESADTPANEFFAALESGATTQPEAMSKVIQALRDVDDQIKQNEIGTALFGSLWEDLGAEVILAMDPAEAAMLAFEGSTGKAQEAVRGGLGGAWERLQRVLQVVLADGFAPVLAMLVENITPAFEAFATWLKGDGRAVLERFGKLITDNVGPALEKLGPFIEKKVIPTLEKFADWMIKEGFPAIQKFFNWLKKEGIPKFKEFIKFIKKVVIPALDRLIHPFRPIREAIDDTIEKFEQMKEDVGEALDRLLGIVEDVLSEIESFFTETLGNILSDAIQWGRDLISEWASFLADLLSDVIAWGSDLIAEWASFLADLLSDVIAWGSDLIAEWASFLSDLLSDVIQWGSDLIAEWASFLSDLLSDIVQWGQDLISEWASFLSTLLSNIVQWGAELIATWASFLGDVLSNVIQWGQDLIAEFASFLSTLLSNVAQWGVDLIATFTAAFADVISEVITWGQNMLNEFAAALANIIAEVVTWAVELYNTVRDALLALAAIPAEIMDTLTQIGADIIAFIIQGIQSVTTFVSDIVAQFVTWFTDLLGQLPSISQITDIGIGIVNQIWEAIQNWAQGASSFADLVKSWLEGAMGNVRDTIVDGASNLYKAVKNIGENIVSTIVNAMKAVQSWIVDGLKAIINWAVKQLFPDAPDILSQGGGGGGATAQAVNNVGASIVAGIVQGVYNSASWLSDAMVWVVQNAMFAAQRAAGIHSPSALFASLGHDLMAGLQMGMAAQMPAIQAQVSAAVTAPALGMVSAPVLSSGATTYNTFNLGGNNISNDVDGAVFEARVMNVIQRNLSGAGGGLL